MALALARRLRFTKTRATIAAPRAASGNAVCTRRARPLFHGVPPRARLVSAYLRIAGVYAAGFVSNAWYPANYSDVHSAIYLGSTAVASDIVRQEFKEFWPDIRHKIYKSR